MKMNTTDAIVLNMRTEAADYGTEWTGGLFCQGLRAYRSSPCGATIQVRHAGTTTQKGKGKKRYVIASVPFLSKADITALIDTLTVIRDELQEDRPRPKRA